METELYREKDRIDRAKHGISLAAAAEMEPDVVTENEFTASPKLA